MIKPLREQVVSEIERFLRRTGISKSRFGRESVNNEMILDQMRAGSNPRADTIDAMRAYMRDKIAEMKAARPSSRHDCRVVA